MENNQCNISNTDKYGFAIDIREYYRNNPDQEEEDIKRFGFAHYGGVDAELLSIDLMDDKEDDQDFDRWCAKLLADNDYKNVRLILNGVNSGAEVLAEKDGVSYAIMCVQNSKRTGKSYVQKISAAKHIYGCTVGVVMTNSSFVSEAYKLAKAEGVLLWDRTWIKNALASRTTNTVDSALFGDHI